MGIVLCFFVAERMRERRAVQDSMLRVASCRLNRLKRLKADPLLGGVRVGQTVAS